MTPARFRWGLILILIGSLILLRNVNFINDNFWPELITFLPALLIAIGIEKIFSKSKFSILSYLSSVLFVLLAALIVYNSSYTDDEADSDFFSRMVFQKDYDPGVESMYCRLDLDESDLMIRDAGEDLIYARFGKYTTKPKISYKVENEKAVVRLNNSRNNWLGGIIHIETDDPRDWFIRFNERIPLHLECTGQKSEIHMNLADTPVEKLDLDADDATIYIRLGNLIPRARVNVIGMDSDLQIRVPESIGIKIKGDEYGSYFERVGFIEHEGVYMTEGYDTLASRVDIEIDGRLSSFSIDYY